MKLSRSREYTVKLGNYEMVKFGAAIEDVEFPDDLPDTKIQEQYARLDAMLDQALDAELQAAYELTDAESFVLDMFDAPTEEKTRNRA